MTVKKLAAKLVGWKVPLKDLLTEVSSVGQKARMMARMKVQQ